MFEFFALTEVNAYLSRKYFGAGGDETQIVFRQKLALDLITYFDDVRRGEEGGRESRRGAIARTHRCMRVPIFFYWREGKWDKSLKSKYQQHICKHDGCKKDQACVCMLSNYLEML